ncbi:hypothetical protein MBRA1_002464 [Malassezia brasiliensis]|uniref:Ribosomal protein S21 n=1 Tax=Malassezia brasiliensis TaxID=1821822 RepID=A0AAF0DT94_9BASI|nr:hypothetical protein MBRA1_002464 [Malassezia brasiliensis]
MSAALRQGVGAWMRYGAASVAQPNRMTMPMRTASLAVFPRWISTSAPRAVEKTDAEQSTANAPKQPAQGETPAEESTEASRAALWDQMLNTIVVDPVDGASADARLRRSRDALGAQLDSWPGSAGDHGLSSSVMDQLESEFRARQTIGPATPATPTTGRTVSAANSFGNSSAAMLYRNLMGTLRRNNVRRELRLEERYEKPNQKRRRLRSERHRRRFADMIRKKVQLVRRAFPLTQIMALKARGA